MGGMFSDYIIFWLTLEGERFFNRWPKWAVFDLLRLGIVSAPSSSPSFPPFALHCFLPDIVGIQMGGSKTQLWAGTMDRPLFFLRAEPNSLARHLPRPSNLAN